MKIRKKPVEVEAILWDGSNEAMAKIAIFGSREVYRLYTSLRQRFAYLPEIDAEAEKEEVTHNLLHILGLNGTSILNKQINITLIHDDEIE
jgi:hypothetical protein